MAFLLAAREMPMTRQLNFRHVGFRAATIVFSARAFLAKTQELDRTGWSLSVHPMRRTNLG